MKNIHVRIKKLKYDVEQISLFFHILAALHRRYK